ncbi:MAG TPA: hypothetical protein VNR65_01200 [Geobacterales bacterium]|nr:hypothetical protein [Geobacterales bacterium]
MRLGKPAEAVPNDNPDVLPGAACSLINRPGTVCAVHACWEMESSHKVIMPMKSSPKLQHRTIVRAVEAQPHLELDKGQETQPWER